MRALVALLVLGRVAVADLVVPKSSRPSPSPDGARKGESRCPVAPLKLIIRVPPNPMYTVVSATADGTLRMGLPGAPGVTAKIDGRGCVIGADGVWAELTSDGNLWTTHEILKVVGGAIQLAGGRSARIASDGSIQFLAADGKIEPNTYGAFSFEGFRAETGCAAMLLFAVYMASVPSMAVVDGAKPLPPPPGSRCRATSK
jgi:hypothetical protein